jgi:uncharacterized protein with HEPN domain
MRNVLAHEYLGVDAIMVWDTANNSLEPLQKAIDNVLAITRKENSDEF